MKATRLVKVKHTVSRAKEPSTSICSRLSGISGGRAIYTPFPAENYGAVSRRKARGIKGLLRNIMVIYGQSTPITVGPELSSAAYLRNLQ